MISRYPEPYAEWFHPDIEADMEIIKDTIHSARSLRSDYKIQNHIKAEFGFQSENSKIVSILTSQGDDFKTLAKGSSFIHFASNSPESIPKEWCVKVVSDQLSLLVNLSGILDIDFEISRLSKELEKLSLLLEAQKRKVSVPDYESKVPEAVRITNAEKLAAYEVEYEATLQAKRTFESMKA